MSVLCFAAPKEPQWFRNYREVYPNSQYLAQRGTGNTAEQAKTDAASQLARYFQTTVNANLSTTMSSITSASDIQEETWVIDEVSITSEVDFIGLEFTESYYYKNEKKWYAVAYINREDAWIQYKPKVESAKVKFYGFYNKAVVEEDTFTKVSLYKSAWNAAGDFMEKLEYARIINPKEEEVYSSDRSVMAELPSVIDTEMQNLTLTVNMTGDYGAIIETAIKDCFEKSGFVIGSNGKYQADVKVDINATGDNPITAYPSVVITVHNDKSKSIYSYQAKITEKTVSYTMDSTYKKALSKLSDKIIQEVKL